MSPRTRENGIHCACSKAATTTTTSERDEQPNVKFYVKYSNIFNRICQTIFVFNYLLTKRLETCKKVFRFDS